MILEFFYLNCYLSKYIWDLYLSFVWQCHGISKSSLVSFRHQKACYYFPVLISFFSSGQHSWLLVLGTFTHTYIMCLLLSHVHCQLICPSSQRQYLYIRFVSGMGILWRRTTGWEFFGRQNSLKNISEFRKAVSSGTMYLNIKAWFLNDLLFNFTNKTNRYTFVYVI